MPRNNSNNTLKQVAAFLLVIILLAVIGVGTWIGVVTNGFRDWSGFTGPSEPAEGEQVSGVTDGDGNEMQSGESYALPAAMVYAVPTAQSATASEGITVTATVLPETAVNKNVMWAVRFANASSEWATGKTASDYVTVTPDAENSRIATVVCNEAFGEQIILTVASVADPTKMASCTIDYAQSMTNFALSFGDVACNFSGTTSVPVQMTYLSDEYAGGVANAQIETSEVYTIADELTVTYSLSAASVPLLPYQTGDSMGGYKQNWLAFGYANSVSTSQISTANYDYSILNSYDVAEKGLYFGISYFAENMGLSIYQQNHPSSGTVLGSYLKDLAVGGDYDTSLLSAAFDNLKEEGSEGLELFTLTVTVSGTYTQKTYTTTFVMGDSSSETVITGVTLDPTEIIFSGAMNE